MFSILYMKSITSWPFENNLSLSSVLKPRSLAAISIDYRLTNWSSATITRLSVLFSKRPAFLSLLRKFIKLSSLDSYPSSYPCIVIGHVSSMPSEIILPIKGTILSLAAILIEFSGHFSVSKIFESIWLTFSYDFL